MVESWVCGAMKRFRVVHGLDGWLRVGYMVRWRDLGFRTGWLVERWVYGAMERFRVVHGAVAGSLINMLFYC